MEQLVRDFMRAVRGDRSQVAFSRRAGCASNVAAQWESGRRMPSAATALSACARVGLDLSSAFDRFHRDTATLIRIRGKGRNAHVEPKGIAEWLRAHRARMRATEVAERAGISTFKLSRILSGKTGVSLADFFVLVQVMTARLTDLIAVLVDISEVPSVARIHAELEASRALVFADPWTSAVLALLETEGHLAGKQRSAEFLSERLGLDAEAVERVLAALSSAGLTLERAGKHCVRRVLTIDTRGHPEATLRLRRHWANVGAERLSSPGPRDLFAYNVFSISRADFERIRELEQQYFREARAIIAASKPSEVAGLLSVQLFQWDDLREHG